jgi:hypothetical protein
LVEVPHIYVPTLLGVPHIYGTFVLFSLWSKFLSFFHLLGLINFAVSKKKKKKKRPKCLFC